MKHGLKMNLGKTEVMLVGKQREELNKNCVYLGGHISDRRRMEVEVRRRIQTGANGRRNVEGVGSNMDRNFPGKPSYGERPGMLCSAI